MNWIRRKLITWLIGDTPVIANCTIADCAADASRAFLINTYWFGDSVATNAKPDRGNLVIRPAARESDLAARITAPIDPHWIEDYVTENVKHDTDKVRY